MIKTLLYEKVVPLWDKLVSQELFKKEKKKNIHLNHGLECYSMESAILVSPVPYHYKQTAHSLSMFQVTNYNIS